MVDWSAALVRLEGVGTLAIVLLTGMLWWIERHRSRAVIELRAAHSREHYRVAGVRGDDEAFRKTRTGDPGRATWFALSNRGGVDCMVDMSRCYVMLDRRPYRERREPVWINRLPRYWQDRVKQRRQRIGRLVFFWTWLHFKRWQTEGVAVWNAEKWYEMERRNQQLRESGVFGRPDKPADDDITIKAGSSKSYVAEFSQHEAGSAVARHAILVVRPMVGSPARVRFIAYEPH